MCLSFPMPSSLRLYFFLLKRLQNVFLQKQKEITQHDIRWLGWARKLCRAKNHRSLARNHAQSLLCEHCFCGWNYIPSSLLVVHAPSRWTLSCNRLNPKETSHSYPSFFITFSHRVLDVADPSKRWMSSRLYRKHHSYPRVPFKTC